MPSWSLARHGSPKLSTVTPADCNLDFGSFELSISGTRATAVGLRVAPAGWFPLPDAVVEAFGLPPICPPRSPSSNVPFEQLGVSVDC